MTNLFGGDLKVVITDDGATTIFRGGQPVMDGGWENEVLFRLFSNDWWGNVLMPAASKLSSRFEAAHEGAITRSRLIDIQNAGKTDLQPMVQNGVFTRVDVETTNPRSNTINTVFDLWLYDATYFRFETSKIGQNWRFQILDPANERG